MRAAFPAVALIVTAAMSAAAPAASAAEPVAAARWGKVDVEAGRKLIRENRCDACHAERHGGDAAAIYRPRGRIDTPAKLRSMVERCTTQLNLPLFPDDVDAIAAALDRDHYRFP